LEGAGITREEAKAVASEEMLPVFILVSESGEEIGRLGFLLAPPEKYVDLIKEMLSIHAVCRSLADLNAVQLLSLYRKAEVLQMSAAEEKILKEGLKKDQGVDFLIAYYARARQGHARKARKIKQEIRLRKKGDIATEWELALISFQARKNQMVDSSKIVIPIKKFLRKFGAKSSDYAWKCHFILAEFYRGQKDIEKTDFHAKKALETAPEEFNKIFEPS